VDEQYLFQKCPYMLGALKYSNQIKDFISECLSPVYAWIDREVFDPIVDGFVFGYGL